MKKREKVLFNLELLILIIGVFVRYYENGESSSINTTVYAFHYGYGFISRGLVGTIFQLFCDVFGMQYYTNESFKMVSLFIHFFLMVLFAFVCNKLINTENGKQYWTFLLVSGVIIGSMFITYENFGRLDAFEICLTIIGCLLIANKKYILSIPIGFLCMCIHQGYVFMFFNLLFSVLLYVAYKEKKKRIVAIGVLTVLVVFITFFRFEIYGHGGNAEVAKSITQHAKMLSLKDHANDELIDHEILGVDLYGNDKHVISAELPEFICFLVLISPYVILLVMYCVKIIRKSGNNPVYWIMMLASLSLVPEFVLKTDYGRWIFAFLLYYILLTIFLLLLNDECVIEAFGEMRCLLQKHHLGEFLLLYALFFIPFRDEHINDISNYILDLWPIKQLLL